MDTELPHSRIRTIMKSSLDTGTINTEVLFLMTKATVSDFQKEATFGFKLNLPFVLL